MIKEALEYFQKETEQKIWAVDGLEYSTQKLHPITEPVASALLVNTLQAIVDYLKTGIDHELPHEKIFAHVVSPNVVMVLSNLNHWENRDNFVTATTNAYKLDFKFGEKYSIENFLIALQSSFVPTDEVALLVKILGNVQAGKVKTSLDDGVSQTVLTKQGSTLVTEEKCPNPIVLHPWRTFREVDQPASSFVFRLHQDGDNLPKCALYEADGSAWQLEAIKNIAVFLKANIEIPVLA